jgi:hypothetical protein
MREEMTAYLYFIARWPTFMLVRDLSRIQVNHPIKIRRLRSWIARLIGHSIFQLLKNLEVRPKYSLTYSTQSAFTKMFNMLSWINLLFRNMLQRTKV